MGFRKPSEVKKSFANDSKITTWRAPKPATKGRGANPRGPRKNFWPGKKLDYDFLERCKQLVCRIPHPTGYYKHRKVEYRLATMDWGRGSYIDLRQYMNGRPTAVGILLHIDVASKLMPDLVAAIRRLEMEDGREPDKKANITVLYGLDTEASPGQRGDEGGPEADADGLLAPDNGDVSGRGVPGAYESK